MGLRDRKPSADLIPAIPGIAGRLPTTFDEAFATLATLAKLGPGLAWRSRPRRREAAVDDGPDPARPAVEGDEKRLRLAQARYRALVEQIPAVTFHASLSGDENEIYVSPQIESLLGFTQEEWVSDPILWYRQIHPEDRQRLSQEFARACLTGQPFRGIVRVFNRSGALLWVHAEARFVRDEQGGLLFLQGVGFDITEQQQAEHTRQRLVQEQAARAEADRERERLHDMFSRLPAAISVTRGTDHVIEFLNPVMLELTGATPAVFGKPWREAFPEFAREETEVLDRVLATGEPYLAKEWPTRSARWEGERFFNFVCQPLRDREGKVASLLTHSVDVTPQVLARQEIANALQLREDFLSVAAHELRNPINALKLTLHVLLLTVQQGAAPPSPEALVTRLEKADAQVDRLMRLIESLLDVSRITAGRMHLELEQVDLAAVVREAVERAQGEIGVRTLTVRASAPVVGQWDRLRLEQVITNLLSNALKYGDGKPVEVAVEQKGGLARLTVRDHGIGLSPEDQKRIFEKFERAAPLRRYAGLGLGLWITRQIVEALGGRIEVKSKPDEGSIFTVELPMETHAEEVKADDRDILIVEDDADARDSLSYFLASKGYTVTAATHGRDALDRLQAGLRPRLILLDLTMPVMDGWEFRARQLDDPSLRSIPVIVTSATPPGKSHPMDGVGVLQKPIEPEGLLMEIRSRLN